MRIESRNARIGAPLASLHALDWLNFFLAALLTGFGPFVAAILGKSRMGVYRYLCADRQWTCGLVQSGSGRRNHRYDPIQARVGGRGNRCPQFGAVDLRASTGLSVLNRP